MAKILAGRPETLGDLERNVDHRIDRLTGIRTNYRQGTALVVAAGHAFPDVEYIELDSEVHTMKDEEPDGVEAEAFSTVRSTRRDLSSTQPLALSMASVALAFAFFT